MLVDNKNRVSAFANALEKLIKSEELRLKLGKKGLITVEKFSPDRIIDIWENLIKDNEKKPDTNPACAVQD